VTSKEQYTVLHETLNERQWHVFLGTEALKIGKGGISRVARLSKADRKTIHRGIAEVSEPTLSERGADCSLDEILIVWTNATVHVTFCPAIRT
jgi:hypothetical protein